MHKCPSHIFLGKATHDKAASEIIQLACCWLSSWWNIFALFCIVVLVFRCPNPETIKGDTSLQNADILVYRNVTDMHCHLLFLVQMICQHTVTHFSEICSAQTLFQETIYNVGNEVSTSLSEVIIIIIIKCRNRRQLGLMQEGSSSSVN